MNDISLLAQLAMILGTLCFFLSLALINLVMKRRRIVRKLAQTSFQEKNELQSLTRLMPEWLVYKVKDTQYESIFGGIATWLDYARGNLLLATVGSFVAFFGASLAASQLVLFGIVGAAMMVVGLQIIYTAAQDAGVLNTVVRPADSDRTVADTNPEPKVSRE
jgi:hypothetical protein